MWQKQSDFFSGERGVNAIKLWSGIPMGSENVKNGGD